MISIMPEFKSYLLDVAFPNSKIVDQNIFDFMNNKYFGFRINRPGLYHWVLVSVSSIKISEFARLTELNYKAASYLRFRIYTVIDARNQTVLQKKIKHVGVYYRIHKNNSLFNLRWMSSKFCSNSFGDIVFLTSPIQLFGRYRGYDILEIWTYGFRSIIANGYLEVCLSFYCFSLGIGYNDLSSA